MTFSFVIIATKGENEASRELAVCQYIAHSKRKCFSFNRLIFLS